MHRKVDKKEAEEGDKRTETNVYGNQNAGAYGGIQQYFDAV
jgi:hypothetical protein